MLKVFVEALYLNGINIASLFRDGKPEWGGEMSRFAFLVLTVAGALLLFPAQPARAAVTTTADLVSVTEVVVGASFTFSSGGWGGGGTVTGSFDGGDVNIDGQLSSFDGEVSGFSASYSGGTIVGPVSFVFGDLFGLVYDLDGGPLGDGLILDIEGIGATSGTAFFAIGPGPVGLCGTGATCGTIDGPAPTVVSEAPTLPLIVAGLALLAVVRRRVG